MAYSVQVRATERHIRLTGLRINKDQRWTWQDEAIWYLICYILPKPVQNRTNELKSPCSSAWIFTYLISSFSTCLNLLLISVSQSPESRIIVSLTSLDFKSHLTGSQSKLLQYWAVLFFSAMCHFSAPLTSISAYCLAAFPQPETMQTTCETLNHEAEPWIKRKTPHTNCRGPLPASCRQYQS